MASDEAIRGEESQQDGHPAACLFAVRLWKETLDGGVEHRGTVRDVVTDGYRGFRDWSDLIAFMVARLEHAEVARGTRAGGGA